MKVRELMTTQIVVVPLNTPLYRVWDQIFKKHIHGLPVVDNQKRLVGIVSEEDILTKLYPDYSETIPDLESEDEDDTLRDKLDKIKNWKVEKIMNKRVIYTHPDTHIMRALSRMIVHKVRQLPVIDEEIKILGMISKGDIFDALIKQNLLRLIPRARKQR